MFSAIASFLVSMIMVGAMKIWDDIEEKQILKDLRSGKMTPTQVMAVYDQVAKRANEIGGPILDKFNNKVNELNMMLPQGTSSIQEYLTKAKTKAQNNYDNEKQKQSQMATELSQVERSLNDFNNQSNNYKTSKTGKEEFKQIQDNLKGTIEKYPDYLKVESTTTNKLTNGG